MLTINQDNNLVIVRFNGETRFNSEISQEVKNELNHFLEKSGILLIFDLYGIKYIDSSAFGTLISLLKTSKLNNSNLKLCNLSNEVSELLMVMQLDTVFNICTDVNACLKA
ncbi:MAG: STAS domain-containing protein [Bacteroidales bacterium]|nr:STAS domain-containing protein [Bacteroidales bacterium]